MTPLDDYSAPADRRGQLCAVRRGVGETLEQAARALRYIITGIL